jgi:hypothetical protein
MRSLRDYLLVVERADVSSPEFRKWFAGSKVVDGQGRPLLCYHGTRITFTTFQSGSHFGDVDAANTRLANLEKDPPRFSAHQGVVKPVYLSIKNPLRIVDDKGLSDGYDLANAVRKTGAITDDEFRYIDDTPYATIARRRLFDVLSRKGFDGLVYKNTVEGSSDSWVIFRPDQVWHMTLKAPDIEESSQPIIEAARPVPTVGYHVTARKNIDLITQNGLKPDSRGNIYLWDTKEVADWFAFFQNDDSQKRVILKMNLDGLSLRPDSEAEDMSEWSSQFPEKTNGGAWITRDPVGPDRILDTLNPDRSYVLPHLQPGYRRFG